MNKYKQVFPNKLTLLAVIHSMADPQHSVRNALIAFEGGVDGIWLINHGPMSPETLMKTYQIVRAEFPNEWIGVNLLGTRLKDILDFVPRSVNGIWTDNAGVPDERWVGPCEADDFLKNKEHWPGLYFGGTVFKGAANRYDEPADAARRAMPYMDVVTTSGSQTGSAPMVEKLKTMREAIGDFPLANASGNSIDNVEEFSQYTDCLITASSLLTRESQWNGIDELDPDKVSEMVAAVKRINS